LYDYDKPKADLLKAIFPFCIIIHHLAKYRLPGISIFDWIGVWVMYLFFAMSGYGLVISYIKKKDYINGFLRRSLPKLFIPYFVAFVLFTIYRFFDGMGFSAQVELFRSGDIMSFIPTSWFIYILSLFYVFFFIVFRYVNSNIIIKVFLVSGLVIGYCFIAPHIGISHWRYDKCPAFIVGMLFAVFCNYKVKFVRWHMLFAIIILLCMLSLPFGHKLDPLYYSSIMFLVMFILPECKFMSARIVKFFSSMSLEMFIIQYIPIYFIMDHFILEKSYITTLVIVFFVLVLDGCLAYLMHRVVAFFQFKHK
jgi:peptidoglycan/LPS O-acetylase OafA/YrhL